MIRILAVLLTLTLPLAAHMVSISTGMLRVEGAVVRYELRMPLYEAEVMKDPRQQLFDRFRISSGGEAGRLSESSCHVEAADDQFICEAVYKFSQPVKKLDIECEFYAVTVPNHVHILRAERGEVRDQVVFDFTARSAEINFIPPTRWEVFRQQVGAGARRAAGGLASLLFLVALVIGGRSRRELVALAGMFVVGQIASVVVLPMVAWNPAPRFVEAAAALTIAYLAVEILLLPAAGQRWAVVGVLGLFHGLYLALFLRETNFSPGYVLLGAVTTDLALVAAGAVGWSRLGRVVKPAYATRIIAGGLLVFGLAWFFFRIRG